MLVDTICNLTRDNTAINGTTNPSARVALAATTHDIRNNWGHKGHWSKDCWSKGGSKEGQCPNNWKEVAHRGGKGGGKGKCSGGSGKPKKDSSNSSSSNNNNTAAAANTASYLFAFHAATDCTKLEELGIVLHGFTVVINSGENRHYCPTCELFTEYCTIEPVLICSPDNGTFYSTGEGKVPISILHQGHHIEMILIDVLYVPEMPLTLLCVSRMAKSSHTVHFKKDSMHILTLMHTVLFVVPECSGLYPILEVHTSKSPKPHPITMSVQNLASITLTLHEFHCCMVHADIHGLQNMVKKGEATGIKLTNDKAGFCKGCTMGILKREPFPHQHLSPTAKTYSGKVFSDVWGPALKESFGGSCTSLYLSTINQTKLSLRVHARSQTHLTC
jgi:hypothetical protein